MRERSRLFQSAMRQPRWLAALLAGVGVIFGSALLAQVPPPARPPAANDLATAPAGRSAKIWLGREAEFEELLRRARVKRIERIPVGVTHPKVAFVEPGLPFSRMAWKPLRPGRRAGFYESYRSEIAAYELDKLVGLGMVPPAVERCLEGECGAVILWVENVQGWDVRQEIRGPDPAAWTRELVRMQMFDNLSGNFDRNQGNALYDAEHHLVLIDHSRAFTDTVEMSRFPAFPLVDARLWQRMASLTLEGLQPALGKWLGEDVLRAMLERRDRMKTRIETLVAARGDSVWLR